MGSSAPGCCCTPNCAFCSGNVPTTVTLALAGNINCACSYVAGLFFSILSSFDATYTLTFSPEGSAETETCLWYTTFTTTVQEWPFEANPWGSFGPPISCPSGSPYEPTATEQTVFVFLQYTAADGWWFTITFSQDVFSPPEELGVIVLSSPVAGIPCNSTSGTFTIAGNDNSSCEVSVSQSSSTGGVATITL